MGRKYSIPFTNVSASAAQDAFEIIAATGKPFRLHEIILGQTSDFGDAQAEGLLVLIKRATAGYTTGSGGTTLSGSSIPKHNTSDPSATVSAKFNDTTQAVVGSGTLTTVRAEPFNIQGGYQYLPTPETQLEFYGGEALIVALSVEADAITLSGTVVVEEF